MNNYLEGSCGFEVRVQKTFPLDNRKAWELLTRPRGRKIWLGEIPQIRFSKGHKYVMNDGARGEIHYISHQKRMRLSWQPKSFKEPSIIQIHLQDRGEDKTTIRFHLERIADPDDRERMRTHWKGVLVRLEDLVRSNRKKAAFLKANPPQR